jgi:hypothetical protein
VRDFIYILFALFVFFLLSSQPVLASEETVPNNKFGIHILQEEDISDAASLVNSGGGDWGYVTFVIQKGEREVYRWQKIFDELRKKHLIPIVRIATRPMGDTWEKPSLDEIDGWVSFLSSLNWVIKDRFVAIGNEPNHAKEWGGEVNPQEYINYLCEFSKKLKKESSDFYVLPGALDASAPNSKISMEESLFLAKMSLTNPGWESCLDFWNSHSYPNPDFAGAANGWGKGTVRTYLWELDYLKSLGFKKDLSVFITETGWSQKKVSQEEIGNRISFAFENIWLKDDKVKAVTPFVFNYTSEPFLDFSWKDKEGKFFSFYKDVQKIKKVKGEPIQEFKGEVLATFAQPIHRANAEVSGIALVKNLGQGIWNRENITLETQKGSSVLVTSFNLDLIEPGKVGIIHFKVKAPDKFSFNLVPLVISYKEKGITNSVSFLLITLGQVEMKIYRLFGKI